MKLQRFKKTWSLSDICDYFAFNPERSIEIAGEYLNIFTTQAGDFINFYRLHNLVNDFRLIAQIDIGEKSLQIIDTFLADRKAIKIVTAMFSEYAYQNYSER